MSILKAALGSFTGTLSDQWKEFFYCDSIDQNVLVTKGFKKSIKKEVPTLLQTTILSQMDPSLQ